MKNSLIYLLFVVGLSVISTKANADFVEFQNLNDFLIQFPNHSFEDFEEANIADGGVEVIESILNSTSDNAVFQSGDIVNGLQIRVTDDGDGSNLLVSSPGFANYESHAISYDVTTAPQQIIIDFLDEDVSSFAFDLTSSPIDGLAVTVNVFSGDTSLGDFLVSDIVGEGTFFGGFSDSDLITRVELSTTFPFFFGVDNVRFAAVPEPSSMLLLITLSTIWCAGRRRQSS